MSETVRRCRHYIQCEIAGVPYLLPYGQKIADHGRGLRINETSSFLWELLDKERTFDELLRLYAQEYHADRQDLPILEKDLRTFLNELLIRGLLETPDTALAAPLPSPDDQYIHIGGLVLRMCGPKDAFHTAFHQFLLPAPEPPHQTIHIMYGAPSRHTNGTLLLRNEELIVIELPVCYILLFPSSHSILEARLQKDGSLATFFCQPSEALSEELFHAIRLAYLYLAQRHSITALHSASLLYRGRAWLFSGPSGTGKSTHTNLWNHLFGTPLLNGDLNLLALQDGLPIVYGLPWCGTSQISTPETHPLGGIILLKQAPENEVEYLSIDRRRLLTAQRLISPTWTEAQFLTNLQIINALEPHIFVCRLRCTPEQEAAWVARRAIDNYLDNEPSVGALPLHPATL